MTKAHHGNETHIATGCEWKADEDGLWNTGCGQIHIINEGGPVENGMKFCCYCGLALDELPYEEPEEEADFLEDCDGLNGECSLLKGHEGACSDLPF